jgi:hypothetical protein
MDRWKDVVSVYSDVRAANAVEMYRGITVNNFNNSPIFRLLIYLVLQSPERQNSQTLAGKSEINLIQKNLTFLEKLKHY